MLNATFWSSAPLLLQLGNVGCLLTGNSSQSACISNAIAGVVMFCVEFSILNLCLCLSVASKEIIAIENSSAERSVMHKVLHQIDYVATKLVFYCTHLLLAPRKWTHNFVNLLLWGAADSTPQATTADPAFAYLDISTNSNSSRVIRVLDNTLGYMIAILCTRFSSVTHKWSELKSSQTKPQKFKYIHTKNILKR